MRLTLIAIACAALYACGSARSHPVADAAPDRHEGAPVAFRGTTVIDVSDGSRLLDHTVIVDAGRIIAVSYTHLTLPTKRIV